MSNLPSTPPLPTRAERAVKIKTGWLRPGIHLIGVFPLLQLAAFWFNDRLTANPIQWIEQHFGRVALNLLVASLAVTPVVTLSGWKGLLPHRRTLGLYSFFYFALHFLTFAALDYGLDWREILRLTVEKPFIIAGALAGGILLVLAFTSFQYWKKRLGKNWRRLHKAAYLAGGLAVLHYAWAVKGSLATLSGDILRPLGMGLLVILLLLLRLPPIRRRAASWRHVMKR